MPDNLCTVPCSFHQLAHISRSTRCEEESENDKDNAGDFGDSGAAQPLEQSRIKLHRPVAIPDDDRQRRNTADDEGRGESECQPCAQVIDLVRQHNTAEKTVTIRKAADVNA